MPTADDSSTHPLYRVFFPDESHTLACMLREGLQTDDDETIAACVVTDDMHSSPGLVVTCQSKELLLSVLDDALALLDRWDATLTPEVVA